MNLLQSLGETRLVAVANIVSAKDAPPLARALMDAGLRCLEVTLRTAAAADAIRSTPGDTSMARGEEVFALAGGASARIRR
jgi:2-dehydro-3-deoxyphosphogluconate aldolase/(4S)-4-hydroxy-2-oxoglutarate aldolase